MREDGRLVGGKGYVTERNGRSCWEWQGIVAFCTCQWNEWMQQTNHLEISALPMCTNCTHYMHPTTHTDRSHVWEGKGKKK